MRARSISVLLVLLCLHFSAWADKAPIKFGKVSKEEVDMEAYPDDPEAEAAILCDYGSTRFMYTNGGFQIVTERTCRIKIFSKEGLDWADWSVRLYDSNNYEENLSGLKGYTYNLENGKVVEEKLSKDNIFEEKTSDNIKTIRFKFPKVKEGSVVEFTYKKISDYFLQIDRWYFQRDIPVKYSEYSFEAPEYFNYLALEQGYARLDVRENYTKSGQATISSKSRTYNNRVAQTKFENQTVTYAVNGTRYVAKNVPALKPEKYTPPISNFFTSIEHQLASTKWPEEPINKILSDWQEINETFSESDNFGMQIKSKGFYKEELEAIQALSQDDASTAYGIYKYISNNIKWDGKNGMFTDNGIRKAFMNKTGNDADINLLLISMLRAAGIPADPVIISTREHGLVNPIHPIMSKYNYVIAEVTIGDHKVLMDATQSNLPLGLLPHRCLNQMGRRISEANSDWVSLTPTMGYEESAFCQGTLTNNGSITGMMQEKIEGYSAIKAKSTIDIDGEEKFVEQFKEDHANTTISDFTIESKSEEMEIIEKYNFEISNVATIAGNMIYLNPLLENEEKENPFKDDERKLPVDFGAPVKEKKTFTLTIPEGYTVEEMPESTQVAMPENAGLFKYHIRKLGPNIQLIYQLQINKTFYSQLEYPILKDFYSMVYNKQAEQIVLKKATE